MSGKKSLWSCRNTFKATAYKEGRNKKGIAFVVFMKEYRKDGLLARWSKADIIFKPFPRQRCSATNVSMGLCLGVLHS